MAYATKNLKKQLVSGSPQVAEMFKAIKEGTYDVYSQSIMPKKTYSQSRKLSKTISKYKN
jgi:cytochrome c551/c552